MKLFSSLVVVLYRFCQGGFFRVLHIFVIEDKAPLRSVPELVVHRHLRCLVVCFINFNHHLITFDL
jgi:hypothetical protein